MCVCVCARARACVLIESKRARERKRLIKREIMWVAIKIESFREMNMMLNHLKANVSKRIIHLCSCFF